MRHDQKSSSGTANGVLYVILHMVVLHHSSVAHSSVHFVSYSMSIGYESPTECSIIIIMLKSIFIRVIL